MTGQSVSRRPEAEIRLVSSPAGKQTFSLHELLRCSRSRTNRGLHSSLWINRTPPNGCAYEQGLLPAHSRPARKVRDRPQTDCD
jgi:hypothetical protein